jgi:FtsH-binding integral membrane protein
LCWRALANVFIASSALQFVTSVVAVLVSTGLTAYDNQRIKEAYIASDGEGILAKNAILGGQTPYLDFINLFGSAPAHWASTRLVLSARAP